MEEAKHELDLILQSNPFSGYHSYSVTLGQYRLVSGERSSLILLSVYSTKWECLQRKFEGETFADAIVHLKRFVSDTTYVQIVEAIKK